MVQANSELSGDLPQFLQFILTLRLPFKNLPFLGGNCHGRFDWPKLQANT
jgi:hypothetical protein